MKKTVRRLGVGLGLLLLSGWAVAATQRAMGASDIFFALMLVFWVGLPVLFLCALAWELARPFIASFRRPTPPLRVPDTDLMA
jgi:hypothetical protein